MRALFVAAVILRVGVFTAWPAFVEALSYRPELSTPISAQKRLREGVFLYQRGLDPYDGGTFHQAPLLLPLYSLIDPFGLLFSTLLDLIAASCLYQLASSKAATTSSQFVSKRSSWSPTVSAAAYLFNPFIIAACLAQSTSSLTNTFILLALTSDDLRAGFSLAVATYLGLHPVLLLPAVGLLVHDRSKKVLPFLGAFFGVLGSLLLASRAILPSWQFLSSVYLTPLMLPDLSPNSGLWWYFFIEMFDAFREFFLAVFWLHMLAYSVPVCLRLKKQPLAAVCAIYGAVVIFQPYANAADAGAWLAMLSLFGHTFALSSTHRHTFNASATLMYSALLGPAFHYLWIIAGSGNANFYYAITLVWNLGLSLLLTGFIYAVLRDQWETEREGVEWKAASQI